MKKTRLVGFVLVMMVMLLAMISCQAELNVFRVDFDSMGGSPVPSVDAAEGMRIVDPGHPEKKGYVFNGWYQDAGYEHVWDFNQDTVGSNTTLYAKWAKNLTVSFDSQGGSTVSPVEGGQGMRIREPVRPTKTGSLFDGWYRETTCETEWDFATDVAQSDMTLYAKWLGPYRVEYDCRNGSSAAVVEGVLHGAKITEPTQPRRDGFVFWGWYMDTSQGETEWDFVTDVVQSNMTIYAKWSTDSNTVSFDSQGGAKPSFSRKGITYGQAYGALPAVKRSGYGFGGWWTGENGTGEQVFAETEVSITSDQILYAKWHLPYTVIFDSQGGSSPSPTSKSVTYGQSYGALPSVMRDGYWFAGWWTGANGTGTQVASTTKVSNASNQTLYAKWKVLEVLEVGNIGLSGGYVFYENPNWETDGWRYLEAAPAGWSGAAADPSKEWGGYNTLVGGTGTAIGTGAGNTQKIVATFGDVEPYQSKPDYAAKLCADYRGGGYDDWFLPSLDELILIYDNLYLQNLGGFSVDFYWSSSEYSDTGAWNQNFYLGIQRTYPSNYGNRVRPIRAF